MYLDMKRPIALFALLLLLVARTSMGADAAPSLAGRLRPFVEKGQLAGAVALVVDREKVLSVDAVSFADVARRKPMKSDALFWIASQTKPMTAVAVMMLVDEGKVALDDAVDKYLPEFRGQMVVAEKNGDHTVLRRPGHPITVREVLCHTSGMPFQSPLETPTHDTLALASLVRSYAMIPLQTEPGTHYQYSSAGINIAGRIVEVVSGMPYEDFMRRRLFDPLGMKDTTFWPTESQTRRLAKAYRPDAGGVALKEMPIAQLAYPLSDRTHRFPIPAGGLFSTARDTARFCQMLLNGGQSNGRRLLSEKSFVELTRRQTPASVKENYGLCLALGPDGFGHGGALATGMDIRPGPGIATIWMVQHAGFPGDGGKAQGVFRDWALERHGKPVAR